LPAEPYTTLLSQDGHTLFVSLWGGARVLSFDASTLAPNASIEVGEHPNAMALSPDGRRLFVACASTNAVWAIDIATGRATEQISVALFPKAPPGSTPNSVSVSPDGTRLLVANADNNAVALVDIAKPGSSRVLGFIPTGWYPTGAMFSRDATKIYVLSGKGLASMPNVRGAQPGVAGGEGQYIGSSLEGSLSILPTPDEAMT
jgi:YVTN family beta-propeller protein